MEALIDFLEFKDWLNDQKNRSMDWIEICRWDETELTEMYGTICALVPEDTKTLQLVLETWEWDITQNFGQPYFAWLCFSIRASVEYQF